MNQEEKQKDFDNFKKKLEELEAEFMSVGFTKEQASF